MPTQSNYNARNQSPVAYRQIAKAFSDASVDAFKIADRLKYYSAHAMPRV
jgi:hypothetical protein